ncbi:hypothetical protein KM043_007744 [Ampulex compressa]|nr:hypothetical protein KM043_007744 [Ampulex compressa]
MSTRTLNDIRKDIKQLITAITSFEEHEEGFRVCEQFCLSNIKHHRYLSVNSNATKKAISEIVTKFSIHGKYDVAKKFKELIDVFLSSFDFEQHPQYDLQWYLLTLLLDLSTETNKSELKNLKQTRGDSSLNAEVGSEIDAAEEIDWGNYLKEGQDNFFCDYKSDDESDWSEDNDEVPAELHSDVIPLLNTTKSDEIISLSLIPSPPNNVSLLLAKEYESRSWLQRNVQNSWWNEFPWRNYPVSSQSADAHLCHIWQKAILRNLNVFGTVSEYEACRELLWMFHVQAQMVLFQLESDSNETTFSICPYICIPSLTAVAFNSILLPFCELFKMMHEIEQFGVKLHLKNNAVQIYKKPPFTYEAYYMAIKKQLIKIKSELIIIEKDVMRQECINTLLSVSTLLKKHINEIKVLYEIHKIAVSDWELLPNWKCASRLLSKLYFEIQNSHSREKSNICANLYLSSLAVYLNIIDTWLSEGRFEDWRDEFIFVRVSKDQILEDDDTGFESCTLRSLDDICIQDPIMQFLIQKVKYMGQSIEFLVSLDRIMDIWKLHEENDIQTCLVDEFHSEFQSEISKYDVTSDERTHSVESPIDETPINEYSAEFEKNIVQQLSDLNNPFLMKAFEDYIPSVLYKQNDMDTKLLDNHSIEVSRYNLHEKLEKVSQCILPFRKILVTTLSKILVSRYNNASRLVRDIMVQEYRLESHLVLMRSVYMMEAGHIMNKFYQILFHEIESNKVWNNSYFLSCILEEILSQQWPDSSTRWSVTVNDGSSCKVVQAVDSITVNYAVGWPINTVLNPKALMKYNEIFRFQLKLKWALWTLNNLRFIDLEGSRPWGVRNKLEHFQIRRLESLRFWLLHAIGSIHAYLAGQVLQSLGFVLQKALTQADSLDVIISVHNEYLDKVHEHCLLTAEFEDIMATIYNLIEMCSYVRDRWSNRKSLCTTTDLDLMENSYIKYHTYLALALHNAVQNRDVNYLTGLSSAFNCSMPCV